MRAKKICAACEKHLTKDEVALSNKMLGRKTKELYCVDCLAELLDCERDDLEIKIMEFKEQGCALFM